MKNPGFGLTMTVMGMGVTFLTLLLLAIMTTIK